MLPWTANFAGGGRFQFIFVAGYFTQDLVKKQGIIYDVQAVIQRKSYNKIRTQRQCATCQISPL